MLENCFYTVLDQSWKAAIIVLIVLAIRRLIGRRLSPAVRHALWLFVALAVVIPGSILPRATLTLPVEAPANHGEITPEPQGVLTENIPQNISANHAINPPSSILPDAMRFSQNANSPKNNDATTSPKSHDFASRNDIAVSENLSQDELEMPPNNATSTNVVASTVALLAKIWLVGFVAVLMLSLTQLFAFRRKLACAKPVRNAEILAVLASCQSQMGIGYAVPLFESRRVAVPMLMGLLRPRIVIPVDFAMTCTSEQFAHFFLHELSHLKRRDILCGWVMSLLCLAHWFNPLLWVAVRKMNDDAEQATDQLALTRLPRTQHAEYGRTLLAIAEKINLSCLPKSLPVQTPGVIGILESSSQLTRRIEMITHTKNWKHRWVLLAVTLCVLVSLATYTRFQYAEAKPDPVEMPVETPVETLIAMPVAEALPEDAAVENAEDPDAIPLDGTAQELHDYVQKQIGWGMPVPDNDEERSSQVKLLERSLKATDLALTRVYNDEAKKATDQWKETLEGKRKPLGDIVPREPEKDLRTKLLEHKNFLLWLLNDYAEGYEETYLNFIAELEASPADHEVAERARGTYLNIQSNELAYRKKEITREEFFEHKKRVMDYFEKYGDNNLQTFTWGLVTMAIKLADQENDRAIANETADFCTKLFENSSDEFNRSLAHRPHAILNKHYLPVDGLQIQGKLFNGETFDLAEYRGKPLLVVFWKSDPTVEDNLFSSAHASHLVFPKLKEIYSQYHDQGLEIVGVCTDGTNEGTQSTEIQREHTRKTAGSLPWKHNVSEKMTIDAGMPSNEKKYDLYGQYIFFIGADGKILHQQFPNCADFDSANEKGINITGMFGPPMKYLTEELEQKIKDYFSNIAVRFYVGQRETVDGRETIIEGKDVDPYRVEGDSRFIVLEMANHSGRDLSNVELVVHAPTKMKKICDAVTIKFPDGSAIEKADNTWRLNAGTLSANDTATMTLEMEIGYTERYLELVAEVFENGERYGRYEILLEVKKL